MERRSTRLPTQAPKSLAEDDLYPEEDLEPEESDVALSKKLKGKKRKINDDKADGQPQAKKVRGKRGFLKQLVEMPLDLLFEIFGRLEPIDLLHLARTTKDLRTLLMSRSSLSIWKASLSNIPGLPKCPRDLSEPKYANLVFAKGCHICGRNLSNIHIIWSGRLKICTKCLEERFRDKDHYGWSTSQQGYPSQLSAFVPTITINKKSGRRMRYKTLFDYDVNKRWQEEYMNIEDKENWLKNKIEERQAIQEHADACALWYENLQNLREQEKLSVIDDRKAAVVEYLKRLGWEDEFSKMLSNDRKPQNDPLVEKACQKEITERTLSNLDGFLNTFMENQKRNRLIREREDLLKERLPKLKTILQTYVSTLPANALHPSVGELFRNPIVLDIINNVSSQDAVDSIISMLPDLSAQWQNDIEEKLLALIQKGVPEYTFNPDTVLHLATTSFSCSFCHEKLWYPRVLMHSCATRDNYAYEPDADLHHLKNILREVCWNARGCISFAPESLKIMTEAVEMCGFDPKTTTGAEMDIANPIFECVECHDEHEGRSTITWSSVPSHEREYRHRHGGKKTKLEPLNEHDTAIARARISELQSRTRAGQGYTHMVCVHCKLPGNTVALMKHVKKDHGKSPTDEDVIPLLDSNQVPPPFRLWPPRAEAEDETPSAMVTN